MGLVTVFLEKMKSPTKKSCINLHLTFTFWNMIQHKDCVIQNSGVLTIYLPFMWKVALLEKRICFRKFKSSLTFQESMKY